MENKPDLLNHIALPLGFPGDIPDFYEAILGFKELYDFEIDKESAFRIFGINKSLIVNVMEKDGLRLELFHTGSVTEVVFSHLCINVENPQRLSHQASEAGFRVVEVERSGKTLAFIRDHTGNCFELKSL